MNSSYDSSEANDIFYNADHLASDLFIIFLSAKYSGLFPEFLKGK